MHTIHRSSISFFIIVLVLSGSAAAQSEPDSTPSSSFIIEKGRILTGFNFSWAKASRDDFNFEFERGFSRLAVQVNGLYFLGDQIGVGPVLGYHYLYRDFESSSGVPDSEIRDQWEWNIEYGILAGWYMPTSKLFGAGSSGDSQLFVNAGASWLSSISKVEGFENRNQTRFGYQAATGLLIPVGKQIAIETKLQWEARKREYQIVIRDGSGTIIGTTEETKWPSVLSLGIGLKVGF